MKKSERNPELIKNFNHTREYMKDFYIYGFKPRHDFNLKSKRTYDYEKSRIKSWLTNLVNFDDVSKHKQICNSGNCGQIYTNPLYRAYQSKSFTNNDILLHFYILDILQSENKLSKKEITNRICSTYSTVFEEQTVGNKLKEYVKEGILYKEKKGNADIFSLSEQPDFIKNKNFQNALKFFSMSCPFSVVGYYLLNQLKITNDIFFIKHNYIVHTLEDTILINLIQAINQHKFVNMINFGRGKQERLINGIPLKIYTSTQTGRRYLIFYNPQYKRFKSVRLDFIRSVEVSKERCANYEKYSNYLKDNSKYCWGISFGDFRKFGNVQYVKFTIRIILPKEDYILKRLLNECRYGKVEKVSKDLYSCTIDTFDVNETNNWIRSFIGRIVSIESSNKNNVNHFYEDISRMYHMYGGK